MRGRDARNLSALAQAALRELTDPPLARLDNPDDAERMRRARAGVAVAGVVLGHLMRALSSEAARKRGRAPSASAGELEPGGCWVVAYGDRSGVWVARSEGEAARIAVDRGTSYAFVPWGHEVIRGES